MSATKRATKNNRFRKGSAVYSCRICQKRTRETGGSESFVGLCADCYELAGWENTHDDDDHENNPEEDCPLCETTPKKTEKKMATKKSTKKTARKTTSKKAKKATRKTRTPAWKKALAERGESRKTEALRTLAEAGAVSNKSLPVLVSKNTYHLERMVAKLAA